MRSDLPAGLSLLGLSKDRPSIVPNRRVRCPGRAFPRLPSKKDSQSFSRSVPVVSHHLDGFILSDRAGLFRPAPDPGVRPVSSRHETGILTARFLPFEAFPPPTAAEPGRCFQRVRLRGPASRARPSLAVPFTACLAPSPFTPCTVKTIAHPTSAAVARCGCPEPGPRGLAPSSGPLLACPLPVTKARCSLGLGRFHRSLRRPSPPRRTSRRRSAG
jgi:hypothetical protein